MLFYCSAYVVWWTAQAACWPFIDRVGSPVLRELSLLLSVECFFNASFLFLLCSDNPDMCRAYCEDPTNPKEDNFLVRCQVILGEQKVFCLYIELCYYSVNERFRLEMLSLCKMLSYFAWHDCMLENFSGLIHISWSFPLKCNGAGWIFFIRCRVSLL
jgi:hypothetical protein